MSLSSAFAVLPTQKNEAFRGSRFFESSVHHALIAAGGVELSASTVRDLVGSFDFTIAADGGLRLFNDMSISCHLLVGDFDTLTSEEVKEAESSGTRVLRFNRDKAKSDLEIAIDEAVKAGANAITFVGALGGEWDHCVANLLAPLSLCAEYGVWGRLLTAEAEIYLLQGTSVLRAPGRRVSLASLSPRVSGLSLRGFAYPLNGADLRRSQTLCLANRAEADECEIEFDSGELLATVLF